MPEDVRWLSADEQATWRAYLASHSHLMHVLDQQLQRDSDIGHTDYTVLVMLASRPSGSTTVSALADLLDHSQSRTSYAISRLERRDLVVREPSTTDRRTVHVRLTDDGRELLRTAAPGHVACVREHLFDAVSAEQVAALRQICDAMLQRMGRPSP